MSNKQEFNPLIVIPSPRDIDIVEKSVSEILYGKYDVLWVKYYPALEAYNIGANHFKENTNYTHLCMIPNDILLNKESFDMLISAMIDGKYDVLSGICNMSLLNQKEANLAAAVLNALIATRTLNEARKLNEHQYFMWQTARDDKVGFQYCKPLDSVLWKVKDLDEIPIPDQVTQRGGLL